MINTAIVDLGFPRAHAAVTVGNSAANVLASLMQATDDYARILVEANDVRYRYDGSAVSIASTVGFLADVDTGIGCDIVLNRHEIHNFNVANAVASSVGILQVTFYRR